MAFLALVYIGLGWLAGIATNHAADVMPKREPFWQRPRYRNPDHAAEERPIWAWSAIIAAFHGPAMRAKWASTGHFVRSVVVELAGPVLFFAVWWQLGLSVYALFVLAYTGLLLAITVIDLETKLILNAMMGPAIVLALVGMFVRPFDGFWTYGFECGSMLYVFYIVNLPEPSAFWHEALLGGGIGFVVSFIAWLAAVLIYGPGALGQGDVTLSLFLGLILGFPYIMLTFLLTVLLGGLVPVVLLLLGLVNRRSYIPYGPFLTITGWLMLVWGHEIWQYYFC